MKLYVWVRRSIFRVLVFLGWVRVPPLKLPPVVLDDTIDDWEFECYPSYTVLKRKRPLPDGSQAPMAAGGGI
jgi:hypothetical protein